jgi:glutamate carboxypeptidase
VIGSKKDIANRITRFLKSRQEEMLECLKDLVAMESPSDDKASQEIIIKFIKNKLDELGYYSIHVKGINTGGYLYARPKLRDRNRDLQLLVGHCDTVWKINSLEDLPIIQQEGKLRGPGVYDMKAGLTQILYALLAIKELSLDPSVTPIVLINTDEEIGSRESTRAIKRLSKIVRRAFVMEPPLGLDGKLKTTRKGVGQFILTVKGKAAHAGLDPEKGVNAILELSYQVQKLYALNDFKKGISVNIGLIEGGISSNVVAAESRAVIDVRVNNKQEGQYITDEIYKLNPVLDNIILNVEGGIGRPPMPKTRRNEKLWEMAKTNGALIGVSIDQAAAGGGSDGNTTSLYTATLDGLGTTGDGAHARHEFIFTDKLVERTSLLTLLLIEKSIGN